jgi:NAD(P)-dependent dehydrogenase (short-subunit alcohol dehydrogenase family)
MRSRAFVPREVFVLGATIAIGAVIGGTSWLRAFMAKSNGKIALVTVASSGIREATAERLAKAGYKAYGTSRRGAQAGERPFEIFSLDVTSDESVEAAVSEMVRRNGRTDLLANNAGFAHDYARRSRHSCSPAASM